MKLKRGDLFAFNTDPHGAVFAVLNEQPNVSKYEAVVLVVRGDDFWQQGDTPMFLHRNIDNAGEPVLVQRRAEVLAPVVPIREGVEDEVPGTFVMRLLRAFERWWTGA